LRSFDALAAGSDRGIIAVILRERGLLHQTPLSRRCSSRICGGRFCRRFVCCQLRFNGRCKLRRSAIAL